MQEIERLARTSRDLAKVNQELEESRLLAVSDQARTAKRLALVSGQLEYTEQQLFNLTQEMDNSQKDSELLRIERIKREALQEREDAGRLKIETLQDELLEVQRSERSLQQKLVTVQSKYETLSRRHDNLKRQQQELELARESKEALAWLKETTDQLCSPPQGSLGQAIHQEQSSHGSATLSIHQLSPSSSPPYLSSFIDPPLAAQNQLISLIKELATTNSTLRLELNEYRDLLQDTRNEMLALRSQVEDYEHGHIFESCCGDPMDDNDSFQTSKSAWSTLDIPTGGGLRGGLDAVSHIGTLGSAPGSPPLYMTTARTSSRHHQHHFQLSGVRGNVFGELERLYSQGHQVPSTSTLKRSGREPSLKKSKRRTSGRDKERVSGHHSDPNIATAVSTSTSTSEMRHGSPLMAMSRSPLNPIPSKFHGQNDLGQLSPTSNMSQSRRSAYTDADMDMLDSETESGDDRTENLLRLEGSAEPLSDAGDSVDDNHEPSFVSRFAKGEQSVALDSLNTGSSPPLLPLATVAGTADAVTALLHDPTFMDNSTLKDLCDTDRNGPDMNRTSCTSPLSAELQRATQSEANADMFADGHLHSITIHEHDSELHPLDEGQILLSTQDMNVNHGNDAAGPGTIAATTNDSSATGSWSNEDGRHRLSQYEESSSNQEIASLRQQRRLSEPLHHEFNSNSFSNATPTIRKNRPSSIYSLRRPRLRMESPSLHCIHSGHVTSTSVGGTMVMPELQRCKSAELAEQMMTERRQRMMEAWRVGVVAAAVTQQQSIHSVVAFGDSRKDTDNMSVRSKASRRRVKGLVSRDQTTRDIAEETEGLEKVKNVAVPDESSASEYRLAPKGSDSTIHDMLRSEEPSLLEEAVGSNVAAVKTTLGISSDSRDQDTSSHLTIDTATDGLDPATGFEHSKVPQREKLGKGKKRRSVRSIRSVRSPLVRSPMVRSPLLARDRRFPSEATTASEAFSNRHLQHEQSPYQLLHTLSADLLERLARSDTRELNRRLRRTFDIQALSQMSNSVIENVLTDVNNLGERFRWLEAQVADPIDELLDQPGVTLTVKKEDVPSVGGCSESGSEVNEEDDQEKDESNGTDEDLDEEEEGQEDDWGFSIAEFFPLAHTVQEMLSEIGKLRMTINELQLSYVLKVEQDRIKAERDFLQESAAEDEDEEEDVFEERDSAPTGHPSHRHRHRHRHHHHNHHHHQHHPHAHHLGRASVQTPDKPAQLKNVLNILERPRILGSASTGVSGFFNKVFGGNSAQPSSSADEPKDKTSRPLRASTMITETPVISRSKSGLVVAETSKVFAESAWISSPMKPAVPKTPNPSAVAEAPPVSRTSVIIVPGTKLSASTSLAAMATMSPARFSTVHITERVANVRAPLTSAIRTQAIDINFSADTKANHSSNMAQSPPTVSPTTMSVKGMFSRSLPQNQSFGELSTSQDNSLHHPYPAEGVAITSFAPGENMRASASFHSSSFISEVAKGNTDPHTLIMEESSELGSGNGNPISSNSSSLRTTGLRQRPLTMNKTPRSIGISSRSGAPALNVVTKQDIYQEQHWMSSTPSSLSASVSTGTSRATSERRATGDSVAGGVVVIPGAVAGAGSSPSPDLKSTKAGLVTSATTLSGTAVITSVAEPQKATSASVASFSTSAASESMSLNVASRMVSKPILIARSALTVATPSTSTVSSPISTTSWFDTKRFSGSTQGQEGSQHQGQDVETRLLDKSTVSVSLNIETNRPETSTLATAFGAEPALEQATLSVPPSATSITTSIVTTEQQPQPLQQAAPCKTRAITSYHADISGNGSTEAVTRSLGRAGGRESALAFLRGEVPASSILGTFFQSSAQQQQEGSALGQTSSASPVLRRVTSKSFVKGKAVATEALSSTGSSGGNSARANLEALTGLFDSEHRRQARDKDKDTTAAVEEEDEGVQEASEQDAQNHKAVPSRLHRLTPLSQVATTPSHSGTIPAVTHASTSISTGLPPHLGSTLTPTTGLSQRAAVSSTAITYVVATPDARGHGEDEDGTGAPRRKRAVFDRELIRASQKRILAGVPHHHPHHDTTTATATTTTAPSDSHGKPFFVPQSRPRRARALSVDSAQSTEPLKTTEILDLWRAGAGVSRDIWRGLIKKVDGRD
ncbi:hypothetical protein EDD11_000934 [Mortierella claussenii]|nr:hypothetical protein EDD11_000934 [Mortierella claussenii]